MSDKGGKGKGSGSANKEAPRSPPREAEGSMETSTTGHISKIPVQADNMIWTFEGFGLTKPLMERCQEMGLSIPTLVQSGCIPKIMEGNDVVANSPTGSGKTLAFALPMVNHWSKDPYGICGIVLTPTRELAQQIKEQFEALGGATLRVCLVIGGADFQLQVMAMNKRPHFIVATPGRLADHIQTAGSPIRNLFSNLKYWVLDEADRLLGGDFDEQLGTIRRVLPLGRQVLLFTATITDNVRIAGACGKNKNFVYDYMADKAEGSLLNSKNLDQLYVLCPPDYKDGYLMELLRMIKAKEFSEPIRSMIIFAGTRKECQILGITLTQLGFDNVVIHADTDQKRRLQALSSFKSGQVMCLVGTDVVSRGLDIHQVDMVINYGVPFPTDYVHRVGRAGRGHRKGIAVSLIVPRDIKFIKAIEAYIGYELKPLEISESEVLKILTQVNTTKRAAALEIENNIYAERSKINEVKRKMMETAEASTEEDDSTTDSDSDDEPTVVITPTPRARVCPPAPKKRAGR